MSRLGGLDEPFKEWLREVDKLFSVTVGMSYMDIADQSWRDWFDDGVSPKGAAGMAFENEGFEDLIPDSWKEDM